MTQTRFSTRSALEDQSDVVHVVDTHDAPPTPERSSITAAAAPVFDLQREIARGGMGRIVEAIDRAQGRSVAVKFLLGGGLGMRERFAREARITASLQHPGIVPVYYAGESGAGDPFYAMKLVEGRSLAAAIEGCRDLAARLAMLPQVIAVTDALAYAHAHRVIHRDLKPSNVLLGAYGETVVVDWGLAKELGAPEEDAPPLFESGDDGLTGHGRAIGTPRYMPPEQARGEPTDERSDVYALGALLYHLLTGVPPYAAVSSSDVLEEVRREGPRPAESLEPGLAPDLAAVIRKAMARSPGDRYATASEMAEDLRRFTSGRLVSVHRYSTWTLVRRWIARRRTPFAVAAVLSSAMLVLGLVSVRRIVRERDRADAANRLAIAQRGAAERLVGFVISGLRDQLKDLGRLDVLGGVGHEVDAYYQSVAAAEQGPPAAEQVAARAAALETLAEVEDAKHDSARARALYGAARELRHRLAEGDADAAARADEGDLLVKMARFEIDQRTDAAAAPLASEATKLADALLAEDPTSHRGLALAAHSHEVASSLKRSGGDTAGAEKEAALAVEHARRLAALDPDAPAAKRVLGESLAVQARSDNKAGHSERPSFDEAIAVREALALATGLAQDRMDLSESYEQRSQARRKLGNGEGSIADGRHAVAMREELVAQDPENLRWVQLLGRGYDTLAYAYADTKRYEEGIASSRKGLELLNRVARSTADGPEVHDQLLLAYQRLGVLLEVTKRYQEADDAMRPLVALAEEFAAKEKNKRWTSRLADTHVFLGTNAFAQGKTDEGVAEMQKALAIREPLEVPGIDALDWGNAIGTRGTLVKYLKDPAELRRQRLKILDLFLLVQPEPNSETLLQMIADACLGLLPTSDPDLHGRLQKAVTLLLPMRAKAEEMSHAPRLAMLAKAQRLLSN